ncbi:MAG TPA: hypothetical protein VM427_01485 [Patescibacteria group bacterium]|nr:hypothetical protein [Patescibacteria group bacterium]
MRTKLDPDDEFFIPDISGLDWSKPIAPRRIRKLGEKMEIFIDGAVGYQLRLIPSNKVLARFNSTLEAWPVIIAAVEAGRSPRTLSLDMLDIAGCASTVSAGPRLERFARLADGGPHPNDLRAPRRAAEA